MAPTLRYCLPVFLALLAPAIATAQTAPPTDFTTPEGAAFIHKTVGDQLIAFREDGDQDYIYFSGILGWRCGVQELYYGLNDDLPVNQFPLEPCYRELRSPNTSKDRASKYPIFIKVPKGSAVQVKLRVIYEDGTTATYVSERAKNLVY